MTGNKLRLGAEKIASLQSNKMTVFAQYSPVFKSWCVHSLNVHYMSDAQLGIKDTNIWSLQPLYELLQQKHFVICLFYNQKNILRSYDVWMPYSGPHIKKRMQPKQIQAFWHCSSTPYYAPAHLAPSPSHCASGSKKMRRWGQILLHLFTVAPICGCYQGVWGCLI